MLEEEGTNIQTLEFCNCLFRREEAIALASGLRTNQTLGKLALHFCTFEEEHLQQLAESLTHPLEEIELLLDDDDYDSDRGENLQASLSAFISSIPLNCCPLKLSFEIFNLDLYFLLESPLGDLGDLLSREDCAWEDLTLTLRNSYHCEAICFEHFAQGLGTNHSLRQLTLYDLRIADAVVEESLAGAFRQHPALQEVEVVGAELTDFGFGCIGEALLATPNLKRAHIRYQSVQRRLLIC